VRKDFRCGPHVPLWTRARCGAHVSVDAAGGPSPVPLFQKFLLFFFYIGDSSLFDLGVLTPMAACVPAKRDHGAPFLVAHGRIF